MRHEAEISFTLEANSQAEAEERIVEIWSALDWSLVPEGYDVEIQDAQWLRQLP